MKYFVSPVAFVMFLASCGYGIADSSCADHIYKTACDGDLACHWDAKKSRCKTNETGPQEPCSAHRSEWYCEGDTANKCHWNVGNKCKPEGAGASDAAH